MQTNETFSLKFDVGGRLFLQKHAHVQFIS